MATKLNVDPRYNPKTTILGFIFLLIGLGLYCIPYFMELKQEVNHYINGTLICSGIMLVLAPDKVVIFIGELFTKLIDKFIK
jgi:CDP-diglyceride synthetase